MEPPAVLHYVPVFSLLTETFLYEQFTAQREVGLPARILTHERVDPGGRPFPSVRVEPRAGRFSGEWWIAQALRVARGDIVRNASTPRLAAVLREEGAALVHAHYGWSGQYLLAAAEEAGAPLLVTFYGTDSRRGQPPLSERALPRLFEGAARVLALSGRMAERLVELGAPRGKIVVHPLGVRTAAIPFRDPPARGPGELRIVSIGRLVEKKGMDVLLGAAGRLARGGLACRVTIVGGGPEEGKLRGLAGRLPAGAGVEWTGALPRERGLERLRGADLFVLASRTARDGDVEGIPTVLLEAQSSGVPVVSTLHEGIPEAVPAANRRWLAPEGDEGALAGRIADLASRPGEWGEIARRGRAWVEERFDSLVLARRAREIYEGVLGRPMAR